MFGKDTGDQATDGQITEEMVLKELSTVQEPELHNDLVSLNMIRNVTIDDGRVGFTLVLTTMACPLKGKMADDCRQAVMRIPGVTDVKVDLAADTPRRPSSTAGRHAGQVVLKDLLPTVKNSVAVASGKGGVLSPLK